MLSDRLQADDLPNVNMTPMVDVVLCLLVFFMAATKLYDWDGNEFSVRVPEVASAAPLTAAPEDLTLTVVAPGRVALENQTLDLVALELPETTFETEAIWFVPEPGQLAGLEAMPRLLGTLHAAEHALIALLPLWAMCDRLDIGGLSTNRHFQTGQPSICVYDGHVGGVGLTRRGFDAFEVAAEQEADAWRKAMDEFSVWYQVAADDRQPAARLRGLGRAAR